MRPLEKYITNIIEREFSKNLRRKNRYNSSHRLFHTKKKSKYESHYASIKRILPFKSGLSHSKLRIVRINYTYLWNFLKYNKCPCKISPCKEIDKNIKNKIHICTIIYESLQ